VTISETDDAGAVEGFSGSERLVQSQRTASRIIDGRAVVIAIDENELHILNPVGSRVWELSDGRPLSRLVDDIVSEFEVERDRALVDVCRFVRQLERAGALSVEAARTDESGRAPA
jgi:hypothetical protein